MAKTTVSNIITSIKRRFDYDITDSDFDNVVVDTINDALKLLKQWLMDAGLFQEISTSTSFKTVEDQEYVDITKARIVGDVATFTGIANDKIKVIVDGTTYDNISIATCTTIALVVAAINTAVGSTVASASDDGYLVITSATTGATSAVTIADGTTTAQTVVGDLFSVAAERTCTAIADLDEIISISTRDNDYVLEYVSPDKFRELLPDPAGDSSEWPDYYTRIQDRIYFGPQPNNNAFLYIEYLKHITEVTSSSTLPFNNKYDPIIKAVCMWMLSMWLDAKDGNTTMSFGRLMEAMKDQLISSASKNRGMNMQSRSRTEEQFFGPRVPDSGTFT